MTSRWMTLQLWIPASAPKTCAVRVRVGARVRPRVRVRGGVEVGVRVRVRVRGGVEVGVRVRVQVGALRACPAILRMSLA